MNVTCGIQFNKKKANCIRQRFVAIPATSLGQLNVDFFSLYANIVEITIGSISKSASLNINILLFIKLLYRGFT